MKQEVMSFGGQADVVKAIVLLKKNGGVWWRGGDLSAQCGICQSSISRHSMFTTCEPREIISLVTPRHGGRGTNCWNTKRGGESVLCTFYHF
jgi:hypothetical protein